MTPDELNELAALHALNLLEAEELAQAENLALNDPEFRTLVADYQAASATLADLATPVVPSPDLRARILEQVFHATQVDTPLPAPDAVWERPRQPIPPAVAPKSPGIGLLTWLGWGIAAVALLGAVMLYNDKERLENEREALAKLDQRNQADLAAAEAKATELDHAKVGLLAKLDQYRALETILREQTSELAMAQTELEKERARREAVETRNTMADLRIASLQSKVNTFEKSNAVVVWDAKDQRGLVQMSNLPPLGANQDYQLWVVDSQQPNPVDGGIIPVNDKGVAELAFKPRNGITSAAAFAVSVERKGGVPKAEGPIVLVGQ